MVDRSGNGDDSSPLFGEPPSDAFRSASTIHVPGYDVGEEIHRGAQGTVYLAFQQATRRRVALKILHSGRKETESERHSRFKREVELAAKLDHPCIVTIHDSGFVRGHPYYVMQYVEGTTLDTHLRHQSLTFVEKLELLKKICDGIGYAHEKGVVHRDLKPANIRVDHAGEPVVVDFGLARPALWDDSDRLTKSGQFLGTFEYAAPEQTLGDPRVLSPATDVYSLGVILYEALTGNLPYRLPLDVPGKLQAIASRDPTPPSRASSEVDRELETILLKTLSKDPHRRYANGAELAAELDRYVSGEPILARRDSAAYRIRKVIARGITRHAWTSWLLAILVTVILVNATVSLGGPSRWIDRWTEAALQGTLVPGGRSDLADDLVVVTIDDETVSRSEELAGELGIEGVSAKSLITWRPLHGRLMEKMASAAPAVVAWDVNFPTPDPERDPPLVAGIRTLQAVGTRVVLGFSRVTPSNVPVLSDAIRTAADSAGWIYLAGVDEIARGAILTISEPPCDPLPSLSLAAFLAYRYPQHQPLLRWNPDRNHLEVHFIARSEDDSAAESPPTLKIFIAEQLAKPPRAYHPSREVEEWRAAAMALVYPGRDSLRGAALSYGQVLELSPDELRSRLQNKIVLIASTETHRPRPDVSLVPDGIGKMRQEFNGFIHASAISALLSGNLLHRNGAVDFTSQLFIGLAGATAGVWLRRGRRMGRWIVFLPVCSGLVAAAVILSASTLGLLLSPSALLLMALVAAFASSVVEAIRTPAWLRTPSGQITLSSLPTEIHTRTRRSQ